MYILGSFYIGRFPHLFQKSLMLFFTPNPSQTIILSKVTQMLKDKYHMFLSSIGVDLNLQLCVFFGIYLEVRELIRSHGNGISMQKGWNTLVYQ